MKTLLSLLLLLVCQSFLFAQAPNNCGNSSPIIEWPANMYICGEDYTDAPSITTPSNLPSIDYLVIRLSQTATSGNGPAIIYADNDGVFSFSLPSIQIQPLPGEQFLIVPFAYDLDTIQYALDQFLGVFAGTSTCNSPAINDPIFIEMVSYGIYEGASISNLNVWLQFSYPTLFSLQDFAQLFIDYTAALTTQPPNCAGGTSLCYAIGNPYTYTYIPDELTYSVTHVNSFTAQASDWITSSVTIAPNQNIEYEAPCIELTAGFTTLDNSTFVAQNKTFCD